METNELSGEQFLSKKYQDLHKDPDVQKALQQKAREENTHPGSYTREEIINAYIQKLERLFIEPSQEKRMRNVNIIADSLLRKVVIEAQDFPNKYFENEEQLARERGFGNVRITADGREQIIQNVKNDQAISYRRWIDYLISDDAPYSTWFKYYVLRNVAKLQPYNKTENDFPKRSKSTTKIFPEINREALAFVYEALTKSEVSVSDEQLQKLVEGSNFAKLYAHAVERQLKEVEVAKEMRKEIEGSWIKYEQYDENNYEQSEESLRNLVTSLQGRGTGWCTVGEDTARNQLMNGEFYVFYSKDNNGQDSVPRIAIRMADGTVAEVRGVGPQQDLEAELIDTAKEKFMTLPGGDMYEQKVEDMKMLTKLDNKVKEGTDLTDDELRFIYEQDHLITGFGYYRDPRIQEILKTRNLEIDAKRIFTKTNEIENKINQGEELSREELIYLYEVEGPAQHFSKDNKDPRVLELKNNRPNKKADIAKIMNYEVSEVAFTEEETNGRTKMYLGKLFPGIKDLTKLEHIYLSFRNNELKTVDFVSQCASPQELLEIVKNNSKITIGNKRYSAQTIMDICGTVLNLNMEYKPGETHHIAIMSSEEFGLPPFYGERVDNGLQLVFDEIKKLGFEICPPHIALEYVSRNVSNIDPEINFYLGENPVERPNHSPGYLKIEVNRSGAVLDTYGVPKGSNFCKYYVVRVPSKDLQSIL